MSGITAQTYDDCMSLVYIRASDECASRLPHAARRIRRNIRRGDTVLLLGHTCAIVLPATPLPGAETVARRIATLLVDVDCELQAFYGLSALNVWQRLQSEQAIVVSPESAENIGRDAIDRVQESAENIGRDAIDRVQESAESSEKAIIKFPHTRVEPRMPELSTQRLQSMPYLAFLTDYPSRRLLHLFPYELACRYQCVPVGAERDMLTIGTSQRLDDAIIALFQEATRRGIFQVRCEVRIIDDVLRYWQRIGLENGKHEGGTLVESESARQLI